MDTSARPREAGFSLVELLVALAVLSFLLLGVLAVYSQMAGLAQAVGSVARVNQNLRVAMDRIERDLRMIGYGVPKGAEIGGSALWTPAIFSGTATQIGFRADVDGGGAQIICTPKSSNVNCPLTKLRIDSLSYYQGLNCKQPDNAASSLKLLAVNPSGAWQKATCTATNAADTSLTVGAMTDNSFTVGDSQVFTIEQIYYRYVYSAQPPYGYLERCIRYDNTPDSTFPPGSGTWVRIGDHLTAFLLEYRDSGNSVLPSSPLSSANAALVQKIVISMEGYDSNLASGNPQVIAMRSEVFVRNAGL